MLGRVHSTLFHGFIAVAPLKLGFIATFGFLNDLFHGFIAVAPLKQCDVQIDLRSIRTSSTASSPWPH